MQLSAFSGKFHRNSLSVLHRDSFASFSTGIGPSSNEIHEIQGLDYPIGPIRIWVNKTSWTRNFMIDYGVELPVELNATTFRRIGPSNNEIYWIQLEIEYLRDEKRFVIQFRIMIHILKALIFLYFLISLFLLRTDSIKHKRSFIVFRPWADSLA